MKIPKIMAHFISHFPDEDTSHDIALALAQSGVTYLEIQFPFSDPSADGVVIQAACMQALTGIPKTAGKTAGKISGKISGKTLGKTTEKNQSTFSTQKGFALIKRICTSLKEQKLKVPIFIMTYANVVFARGVEYFIQQAAACGAEAVIIPDLPFDSDIAIHLIQTCKTYNIQYIPVSVISTTQKRLEHIIKTLKPKYIYISLRVGTTGSTTEITDEIKSFLRSDVFLGVKVLGGFGIQNAVQISQLQDYVHVSVVGSVIVRSIQNTADKADIVTNVLRVCKNLLS